MDPGSSGAGGMAGSNGSAGASSGSGGSGRAGSGGGGPQDAGVSGVIPMGCTAATGSTALPAAAPALEVGVWKKISPAGVAFHSGGGDDVFTQGIVVDPCNPATLYLSVSSFDVKGGKPGVYKTTDAGSTWKVVGNLDEPIHVRIDPKDPNHLYAVDGVRGATMGFWVSRDAGNTWTMPAGFNDLKSKMFQYDTYDVAADPADFNHVLVTSHSGWGQSSGDDSGVLESKDGGDTWTVRGPLKGWGHGNGIWFLSNSNTWLFGSQGDGFWRTSDGGGTWSQVVPTACAPECNVGNNMQHGGGGVYRSKNGNLYAGGTPHLMRSKDDGATWTLLAPYAGYNTIIGDGTSLYSAPNQEPGALGAGFITAPETNDTMWTAYPGGTVLNGGGGASGPFEMAFDSANRIVYAGCWSAGVWALKVR
jgi:photosystem II stability/assembly factor-like uncharacterized protein